MQFPFIPFKLLGTAVERFLDECARGIGLFALHERSERSLTLWSVEAPEGHLINPELARSFREDRFHDRDTLHSTWRTLSTARWRVRQNRHRTPAHRDWLVQHRDNAPRRESITHHVVGAVVADNVHIEGRDPAFLGETYFHPPEQTGTPATDVMFLLTANAHHDRGVGFFRQERGNHQRDVSCYLAAKSATGVFADEHDIAGVDAEPSPDRGDSLRGALGARVNVDLAVLPVCHRGAGLEALVARVWRDKCLIKDQRRVFQARIDIANRPLFTRLAHRQAAFLGILEILMGPLERLEGWRRHSRPRAAGPCRRRCGSHPDVPINSCVRAAGPQTYQRIDDERQRL